MLERVRESSLFSVRRHTGCMYDVRSLGDGVFLVGGPARFKVVAEFDDQAVLDKETGLVWERTPSLTAQPFAGALQSSPPIAPGNPFENLVADPDEFYWTGTPSPLLANAKIAWSFADTGFEADVPLTSPVRRWCVRGGQNTVE